MVKIQDLVERIRNESGFEVFVGSGGREDLNDWHDGEGDKLNYIRAICNLKNPSTNVDVGSKISRAVWTTLGGAPGGEPYREHNLNVVSYGLLPKEKKVPVASITYQDTEKREGLLGRLGLTKQERKEMPRTKTIYDGSQPLNDIVNTDNSGDAYFINLTIRADILDDRKRICPIPPSLTILGDKDFITTIVSYLEDNPNDYMNIISSVLMQEKFPNVHKGIVEKAETPNTIVFIDADKIEPTPWRGTRNLERGVYDTYGRTVQLKG